MESVKQKLNSTIEENHDWIRNFARFGFFTKGAIYFLLGAVTTMSALRIGGEKAGREDVFSIIYRQPFGKLLLALTALGLLAYGVWRILEAIKNPSGKKMMARLGYAGSAILYVSFAVSAALMVFSRVNREAGEARRL